MFKTTPFHPSVLSLTKDMFCNDHYLLDYPTISTLNLGYIINMDIYQELFQILQSYALDHSSSNGMCSYVVWLESAFLANDVLQL